jgi:tetratricopeptide (TPR) repeat protein
MGGSAVDSGRPPEVPEEASLSMLDPEVRGELRGLPKNLAEIVGRHLAAAGMLLDDDPELALRHARFARSRAARVGVVREAAGLAAYCAGEWAEALSELRAARRMSNGPGHVAIMADCERALGRPERALEVAREARSVSLPPEEAIELRIVAAGARRDMGQLDAAVVALQSPELDPQRRDPWSARLFYAYADNLAAVGRVEEAIRWFLNAAQADDDEETDAAERAIELSDAQHTQPAPDESAAAEESPAPHDEPDAGELADLGDDEVDELAESVDDEANHILRTGPTAGV